MEVKLEKSVNVSAENIADMMITALEGGSNYWLGSIWIKDTDSGSKLKDAETYEGDFCFTVVWLDAEDDDERGEVIIGKDRMAEAWRKFFAWVERPPNARCIDTTKPDFDFDFDAEDADVWLQYLLLDEIVYG